MQNAADEDAVLLDPVKEHVLVMLYPAVSVPNRVTGPAHLRGLRELMKGCAEAVEIAIGLIRAPGVDGVVGDLDEVEPGQF